MKLLTKINHRFLVAASVLLVVCSIALFFLMRWVIYEDVRENLMDERMQIVNEFNRNETLPAEQQLKSNRIAVKKISGEPDHAPVFSDTLIYDSLEQDYVPHRQLSFDVENGNEKYSIAISQSMLESDDLISSLLLFTIIFITALFILLFFINRSFSKNVWRPFNTTLEKLKSFELSGKPAPEFSHSGIKEFEELNQSLNKMTEKIYSDYSRLKQFTENASHEIQTPLSIIRSKIEMLIQSENISEEQMNSIQQINDSVSRLSKLNTALLTLTKIENQQYADAEEIHLLPFIQNKLHVLDEMFQQKKIIVSIEGNEDAVMKMNASLADLLFDNLIGNAFKHNHDEGFIKILIQQNQFTISNSGEPIQIPSEKLFERFVKNNPASDSLGLGLAMVKQICVSYDFNIHFTSQENIHSITINF